MAKIPIFCETCKQEIPRSFFGKVEGIRFEDGTRCPNCAKTHIDKSRRY